MFHDNRNHRDARVSGCDRRPYLSRSAPSPGLVAIPRCLPQLVPPTHEATHRRRHTYLLFKSDLSLVQPRLVSPPSAPSIVRFRRPSGCQRLS
jgi:hypothetical protein